MDYLETANTAKIKESALRTEVEIYEKELSILQENIDVLSEILSPLLLPQIEGQGLASNEAPVPPASVFVMQLRELNLKFSNLNRTLSYLKRRVEV